MLEIKRGTIIKELFARDGIQGFLVETEAGEEKCIAYPDLTGDINLGDEVLLNTTAVSLHLGSGGYHYVISSLNSTGKEMFPGGHIMKMRYTPLQIKTLSVEEEDSPHHWEMVEADSLENIPVLVATLHSMLSPLCLYLKQQGLRLAYVMTDGAALPIAFSQTVAYLKQHGIIAGTITTGHAFGGDLEAVNVYSGLLAARKVLKADIIITSMGPGIVGTGTRWGFTGIEQGQILNAVHSLGGIPVAVPRISFADPRPRHRGISHHSLTVLERVCLVQAVVPLPDLPGDKMDYILNQLQAHNLMDKHNICLQDNSEILDILRNSGLKHSTMGRGIEQEQEFFLALGAAAQAAEKLARGQKLNRIYAV
ncbi:MAG: DUF3866 family protein [Syntrophomonadaceae bacterium]|nr:DUF3866 family protein [Syntrophomonadaceae bacterium]MDD4561816.1 DUF3866 family protein [Syntrophomonadaceae bacterium]